MTEENRDLYKLPKGWVWTTLGEALDYVKGKKPRNVGPKNEHLTIPYINIKAFEHKVFAQFTDGDDSRFCEPNEVLIVWDGARCGLVGRGVSGAIGSTLAKLIGYELNSAYLFYFLQSQYGHINTRPKGVGIPHIDPSVLWNIAFPLPPISEQDRIVVKIEELFTQLDAGVAALEKAKAQLRRYRQAVLKAAVEGELTREWREAHRGELEPASVLLERILEERRAKREAKHPGKQYKSPVPPDTESLPELPERWVWITAETACRIVSGYAFKSKDFCEEGIPVVKIANVGYGEFLWKQQQYLPSEFTQKHSEYRVFPDTVLLALTRPITNNTVKACLYPSSASVGLLNQRVAMLVPHQGYSRSLLVHLLQSEFFKRQITTGMSETLQPNLSPLRLKMFALPLSPLAEQHRIVAEVEQRFSVIDEMEKAVEQSLKRAERLRQSILKRAFEGKLVPQDPSDEPASVLLERIKAEKARCEGERKGKRRSRKQKSPAG